MILLIGYIIIILLNLTFRKSKILYVIDFIYMWILMGWSYNVADYDVYFTRYTYPEIYGTLEPLYVAIQNIGKIMGLSYNSFLAYMSFIFLLVRMILIRSMSIRPNYVIGLYLLFPFIMDITQIRMFYATTIVLLGIFVLMKNYRYSNIFFVIIIIIASMMHSACIIYLLVLVAKNVKEFNTKKYLKTCIFGCVILYIMLPTGVLYDVLTVISGAFGFGRKFIETVFVTSQAYKITYKITYMVEILLFFCLMNSIFKRIMKNNSISYIEKTKDNKKVSNLEFTQFCAKVNDSLLIVLPLAWFSGDIYRVQHGMTILFYIAFSNFEGFRSSNRGKIKLNQVLVTGFVIIFMLLFLLGISSLRETVFIPVFFENGLIG